MLIQATNPLFPWEELEVSPTLATLKDPLRAIPDTQLLAALKEGRHNGCDTYPVSTLWGVLLLSPSFGTLPPKPVSNNSDATRLCACSSALIVMTPFPTAGTSPASSSFSVELPTSIRPATSSLHGATLRVAAPDLVQHTTGDSTGLCGRREPNAARVKAEIEDGLPQASGGREEHKDDEGTVTKVVEWFGYELHLWLMSDTRWCRVHSESLRCVGEFHWNLQDEELLCPEGAGAGRGMVRKIPWNFVSENAIQ